MSKNFPEADDPAANPTTLLVLRSLGHMSLGLLFLVSFIYILGSDSKLLAANRLFWAIITHIFSGAAGNAIYGLHNDMSPWFVFNQSLLTDFVIVLYAYTLFVSSFRHASKWKYFGPKLIASHEFALHYKDRIKPYGIVGLIAFVVFPLWSTGPLVGAIIGYMIGLGTTTTFISIFMATAAATGFYVFAYDWIQEKNSTLALLIMAGVFLLACAAIFANRKVKTVIGEKREHGGEVIEVSAEEPEDKQE